MRRGGFAAAVPHILQYGCRHDIALVPALPPLWASLTGGLSGVGSGADPRVPGATSLFLQYKQPEHVSNRNGNEAEERSSLGADSDVPYCRFKLPKDQLEVPLDLEETSAGDAAVCYAAGVFHRRADFYRNKGRPDCRRELDLPPARGGPRGTTRYGTRPGGANRRLLLDLRRGRR